VGSAYNRTQVNNILVLASLEKSGQVAEWLFVGGATDKIKIQQPKSGARRGTTKKASALKIGDS
jgi:hypothetical protein